MSGKEHRHWLLTWLLVFVIAVGTGLLIRARRATPGAVDARTGLLGQSFRYDVSDLKKVDPKLLIGVERAAFASPVAGALALAVDAADRLYVGGERAIAVLDAEGGPITNLPVVSAVRCLAVDEDGTLYAGHADHVGVYSLWGEAAVQWPSLGTNAVLTSIATAGADVFVADAGNRLVWRLDKQGNVIGRIDGKREGEGGFVIPSPHFDLAIGSVGELWVVDPGRHALIAFARDGSRQSVWTRSGTEPEGFSGCCNPTDIAIRSDGSFVTSEKGLVRVKLYTPAGTLVGVLAGPDKFDEDVRGLDLAVDSKGRVLVLDPARNSVRVFEVKKP